MNKKSEIKIKGVDNPNVFLNLLDTEITLNNIIPFGWKYKGWIKQIRVGKLTDVEFSKFYSRYEDACWEVFCRNSGCSTSSHDKCRVNVEVLLDQKSDIDNLKSLLNGEVHTIHSKHDSITVSLFTRDKNATSGFSDTDNTPVSSLHISFHAQAFYSFITSIFKNKDLKDQLNNFIFNIIMKEVELYGVPGVITQYGVSSYEGFGMGGITNMRSVDKFYPGRDESFKTCFIHFQSVPSLVARLCDNAKHTEDNVIADNGSTDRFGHVISTCENSFSVVDDAGIILFYAIGNSQDTSNTGMGGVHVSGDPQEIFSRMDFEKDWRKLEHELYSK